MLGIMLSIARVLRARPRRLRLVECGRPARAPRALERALAVLLGEVQHEKEGRPARARDGRGHVGVAQQGKLLLVPPRLQPDPEVEQRACAEQPAAEHEHYAQHRRS